MKKIRRAPRIHQLAIAVDTQAGVRTDEIDMLWVFAPELTCDFLIIADGIAAKHFAVLPDSTAHILHNGGWFEIGELQRRRRSSGRNYKGDGARAGIGWRRMHVREVGVNNGDDVGILIGQRTVHGGVLLFESPLS